MSKRDVSEASRGCGELELEGGHPIHHPHRVRHITAIQVRNLTPFPVRDAFASAIKQPSEQPQFTSQGHLADDLDVTVGRKSTRRLSSTSSVRAIGSRHEQQGMPLDGERTNDTSKRRRTLSRASIPGCSSPGPQATPGMARRPSSGGVPIVRSHHRQRTTSTASVFSSESARTSSGEWRDFASTSSRLPDFLQDASQRSLETVLQSRLVETFLTIALPSESPSRSMAMNGSNENATILDTVTSSRASTPDPNLSPARDGSSNLPRKGESSPKVSASKGSSTSAPITKKLSPRPVRPSKLNSSIPTAQSNSHVKSISKSSSDKYSKTPTSPKSPTSPSIPRQHPSRSPSPTITSPLKAGLPVTPPQTSPSFDSSRSPVHEVLHVPDYISPIHWPSTNPIYHIDARSGGEFAPEADLSGSRMHVAVWGRVMSGFGWASGRGDAKGKGKEREHASELEWKVLERWDVNLMDLVPLPEDFAAHPSHLPSNALLVTFSPPGQTFYLPPPFQSQSAFSDTQMPGYSSDPELDIRKFSSAGEIILPTGPTKLEKVATVQLFDDYGSIMRKGKRVTASLRDLCNVIDLQKRIEKTRQSLASTMCQIDEQVTRPGPTLRREASEREARLDQLREETNDLQFQSQSLRKRIRARREDIHKRKEMLAVASELHQSSSQLEFELEQDMLDERERLDSLRSQIAPIRSEHINTLAFIFPIELMSPPDLLFTILDVPLPIPVGASDPAPPLSLPAHKEVTDEAVATALGYSAQVVHLLATYTGMHLVYPVTNVGSRSLIRDSISAMVGPRSFPLFTRGVDTYRFEYGVYLLNKDIELLMSERNLRALDMRHTLPNLKNLILTLTGTEGTRRQVQRLSIASSSASLSSLQSPVFTASSLPPRPISADSATPTATSNTFARATAPVEAPKQPPGIAVTSPTPGEEHESPPGSGSTTPTRTVTDATTPRKSRTFLDLTPLTGFGFLRSRYPTASRASSVSQDSPSVDSMGDEPVPVQDRSDGDTGAAADPPEDEDDRRTIRGRRDTIVAGEEGKLAQPTASNGHAVQDEHEAAEKATNSVHNPGAPILVGGTS